MSIVGKFPFPFYHCQTEMKIVVLYVGTTKLVSPGITPRVLQLLEALQSLLYQPRVSYKLRGGNAIYTVDASFYSCHPQLCHLIIMVPDHSSIELKGD